MRRVHSRKRGRRPCGGCPILKRVSARGTAGSAGLVVSMAVALAVALPLGRADSATAAPSLSACPGNLLSNPGFEGGSRKTEALGTSLSSAVSDGWFPWFVRGGAQVNREPEFKVEQVALGGDPFRVHSGGSSMKWFGTWSTHTAGVYQRVAVPAGSEVVFSLHGQAYSGEADGWSDEIGSYLSDPSHPGNYRMAVGVDPTGAVPHLGSHPPASVVWSPATTTVDQWVPLSVTAVAAAPAVTVYAKGWPEWPVKHNDSFWDDGCLQITRRAPRLAAQDDAAPEAADGAVASTVTSGAPAPRRAASSRSQRLGAGGGSIPQ